jgi:hypothetical protein
VFSTNSPTDSITNSRLLHSQIDAIAGKWHGNTVRLQIEQAAYVAGYDTSPYRVKVNDAIAYAESKGLAVVVNDQSEPDGGPYTANQPLPTSQTEIFWKYLAEWQNHKYLIDPNLILDPFNEPRYFPPGSSGASAGWDAWKNGVKAKGYIAYQSLINSIRSDGYIQTIWAEAPGNYALTELGVTWPKYNLKDGNLVWSFHHTSVDQNTNPSTTEWNVQFGNLESVYGLAVVDGEWTNRTLPPANVHTIYEPSGDIGNCWGDAKQIVPSYLEYLYKHHIGLTAWTIGNGTNNGNSNAPDFLNADGDYIRANGSDPVSPAFTSTNNYASWNVRKYDEQNTACVTPSSGTQGAGQDLYDWFSNPATTQFNHN